MFRVFQTLVAYASGLLGFISLSYAANDFKAHNAPSGVGMTIVASLLLAASLANFYNLEIT